MSRLLNFLVVIILVAAASPDEVLGLCLENCNDSSSQVDTSSNLSVEKFAHSETEKSSHPSHDCKCPIHAHHCCNHASVAGFFRTSPIVKLITKNVMNHFYTAHFVSEPSLDGLLRPPIA